MKHDRRDYLELEELRRKFKLPSLLSMEEIIHHAPDEVLNKSFPENLWGLSRRTKERTLVLVMGKSGRAVISTYIRDMRAGLQHGIIHSLEKGE